MKPHDVKIVEGQIERMETDFMHTASLRAQNADAFTRPSGR